MNRSFADEIAKLASAPGDGVGGWFRRNLHHGWTGGKALNVTEGGKAVRMESVPEYLKGLKNPVQKAKHEWKHLGGWGRGLTGAFTANDLYQAHKAAPEEKGSAYGSAVGSGAAMLLGSRLPFVPQMAASAVGGWVGGKIGGLFNRKRRPDQAGR